MAAVPPNDRSTAAERADGVRLDELDAPQLFKIARLGGHNSTGAPAADIAVPQTPGWNDSADAAE